jgi:transcription elongation factor SPT5
VQNRPVALAIGLRMSSVDEEERRGRLSSEELHDEGHEDTRGESSTRPSQTRNKRRRKDINEDFDEDEEADEDEEGEDEDEDDEDQDAAVSTKRRRTRKKARANMFLDVEAEVDEDEEDLEEEDEDLVGEDGFIQEQDLENEEIDISDDRRHRALDRKRQEITDRDAELLAEEFREKYGRSAASRYRGDGAGVAQRLLMPSVDDPSIWAMKCKTGKERAIVTMISMRCQKLATRGKDPGISAAFHRDAMPGYLYVEAKKAAHVIEAVKDIPNVYGSKITLVSIQEMPDLLKVKPQTVDLVPGAYVRIKSKSSKYVGDLAQVDNVDEDGTVARLRLVPRIDYSEKSEATVNGKRVKKQLPLSFRPPARLFSEPEAMYFPF